MDILKIKETEARLLHHTPDGFVRYVHDDIIWNTRMLCLVGPRGVGKTTLMLQHIKRSTCPEKYLYYNIDTITDSEIRLTDLADTWMKMGGEYLIIDEIHKYPFWSAEIKHIYDNFPKLKVYFTGSSVLDIFSGMADLSRRTTLYQMQGLSFREYLNLFHHINVQPVTLDNITAHRYEIPDVEHPLPLFRDYLLRGYYPFGMEEDYAYKISQSVLQTMEVDIPFYAKMNASTGYKLRRLLSIIADSVPFKPTMQKLAELIGVSRNQLADYILYMERAGMISQLRNDVGGIRGLGKVDKIYLDNPNLCYALSMKEPNIGNLRETFFFNQMRVKHDVIASKVSDFCIDDATFEVGGQKKGQKQVAGVEKSFVVKDDIEYGFANIIPLWAFGLTY